jgi:HSP20 family protein
MRIVPRFPALNVWTNEDGAIAAVRLPGVNADDLDISIKDNTVTIAGSHGPEEGQDEANYLRRELRYGDFSRSFQLPFNIGADKVEATYENGILNLHLPRAEADKPRKIEVKSA